MSVFTKFTRYILCNRCTPEWQRSASITVTAHTDNATNTTNAATNEAVINETEFRILRIKPKKYRGDISGRRGAPRKTYRPIVDVKYSEDVDWTNVWVGPKTFDPQLVPLPLRQGYQKKGTPPGKYANTELMKIPNFLHLTPPAIKKHCEALKKFCTKWPEDLATEEDMEKHFPITITASDYCHSSPSIRNPLSRIVTLQVNFNALELDKHARDKFLRLVGDRYDPKTNNIQLIAKNCPLKKQNYDHLMFILTALCFESWRIEDWEKLKTVDDLREYSFHLRKTKKNIEFYCNYNEKPLPPLENVSEILEKYIADDEESHMIIPLKEEMIKLLNLPKFN